MKVIINLILFFIICVNINADEYLFQNFRERIFGISFYDTGYVDIDIYPEVIHTRYEKIEEYGLPFFIIEDYEKILFLHNEYFAIAYPFTQHYESTNIKPKELITENLPISTRFLDNLNTSKAIISVSSELKEGNIVYEASNLNTPLGLPWVEGNENNGIGEIIDLKWEGDDDYLWQEQKIKYLMIFSGYISYEKPYLFKYNNRPKTIKIYDYDNNEIMIVNLTDTPNPQTIELNSETSHIQIEILDIYKGSKWDDLCIDHIRGFPEYAFIGVDKYKEKYSKENSE